MSLQLKSGIAALLLLALSACGFEPLYGEKSAGSAEPLSGITINPIPGREGQLLKKNLEDKFYPAGQDDSPVFYRLQATIGRGVTPVVIEPDGSISRYNLRLVSQFSLIREADGKEAYKGVIRRINSYNAAPSDFATYVSEQDAVERGIAEIAEEYRMRIAAFLTTQNDAAAKTVEDKPVTAEPAPTPAP